MTRHNTLRKTICDICILHEASETLLLGDRFSSSRGLFFANDNWCFPPLLIIMVMMTQVSRVIFNVCRDPCQTRVSRFAATTNLVIRVREIAEGVPLEAVTPPTTIVVAEVTAWNSGDGFQRGKSKTAWRYLDASERNPSTEHPSRNQEL